jgi:hypothetical protein
VRWVVVVREREGVMAIEPAMIGVATICCTSDFLHDAPSMDPENIS